MHRVLRADLAAQHLDGAVGDHLVGVHVRLRAGTRLPHHEREVVVELAVDDLLRRRDDGIGQPRVQLAALLVGLRTGRLITPSARTMATGCFSQPIGKFMIERWVCAPQYLSVGTSSGPKLSDSVRVAVMSRPSGQRSHAV
jgi:hypothetical protein